MNLRCGRQQMSLDLLCRQGHYFLKYSRDCCYTSWHEAWMLFTSLDEVRSDELDIGVLKTLVCLSVLHRYRHYSASYTIWRFLIMLRSRICSDLRDKIYGCLGLLEAGPVNLIQPDYIKTSNQVYEELAVILLQDRRSYGLQLFITIVPESCPISALTGSNLPNWVPEYGKLMKSSTMAIIDTWAKMLKMYSATLTIVPKFG